MFFFFARWQRCTCRFSNLTPNKNRKIQHTHTHIRALLRQWNFTLLLRCSFNCHLLLLYTYARNVKSIFKGNIAIEGVCVFFFFYKRALFSLSVARGPRAWFTPPLFTSWTFTRAPSRYIVVYFISQNNIIKIYTTVKKGYFAESALTT